MKILWLCSDRMGCGTYRAYVPALTLEERKQGSNSFLLHNEVRDLHEFFAKEVDDDLQVLVFQRAVGTLFRDIMVEAKRRGIGVVFELDDHLFDVPRHNPAAWFWRRKAIQRLLREQIALADRVLVSTIPLRQMVVQVMGWGESDHIRWCPNHLHPAVWGREVWGPVVPYMNQQLVIGWQGSATHNTDFREALPAMSRIVSECPRVMFRFFGNVPLSAKGIIPEERFQWTKGVPFERYPSTLRFVNFDIGIAPVTDSTFNHCKSNVKWLEYSALGIPTVASRVYPYARSLVHDETGLLASTAEEWYVALRALIDDPALRLELGQQAQRAVWRDWSAEAHASRWLEAFTGIGTPRPALDAVGGS